MARYLTVAADANKQINQIVEKFAFGVTDDVKADLVKELAYLYNLGIRTAPRAVQGTVRLNAVKAAIKGFPVSARLEEVTNERDTSRSYKKLVLTTAKKE